jgi:hypothetical protein
MALIILGSRRATFDFDFVVARPGERLPRVLDLLYDAGFEVVSRLDERGEVVSTIDDRKVAAVRLRLDAPDSAYFFDVATGLRVDLLFDFPIAAAELASNATRRKISSQTFQVASEPDLLRLKTIARAKRSSPGDAEDVAFLESLRTARR